MKKAKKKKRMEYTTFKIITGDEKSVKTIRYPRKLPKILLISLVIFIAINLGITYGSVLLSKSYLINLDNIDHLEAVSNQQQQEINVLNEITAEVREKLRSLEKIEAKVKEMVGIED